MDISQEQIKEFKKAKSPEEMIKMAEKHGVKLSLESAKAYFETIASKKNEKVSDNELDSVSGGREPGPFNFIGNNEYTTNKTTFKNTKIKSTKINSSIPSGIKVQGQKNEKDDNDDTSNGRTIIRNMKI